MPKTHPTRRSRHAKASEGLPDVRRFRKASAATAPPVHQQDTNTWGPSTVWAEPAWMDQLLDKLRWSKWGSLWVWNTRTPREAAMPPVGRWWLSSQWDSFVPYVLMHITVAALPLASLCRFSISLQRCSGSSLQPFHWSDFIAMVPVYSRATGQTLLHWFQFTVPTLAVLPLVRLYFIGFSCSPATYHIWFMQVQLTTFLYLHRDL